MSVLTAIWTWIVVRVRRDEEPVDELNEPLERRSVMGRMREG